MKTEINSAIPHDLISSAPLRLEMGIERTASGAIIVACRTFMAGCKGTMLDWWFKYFETEEHLLWWHPRDHKRHFGWDQNWVKGERYIGATVRAAEALGDIPPVSATIKFLDPYQYFGKKLLGTAVSEGHVSAAIFAAIGFGDNVVIDNQGAPISGRMMHVARDTSDGLILRSRFILGLDTSTGGHHIADEIALGLMRHCHSEFTYLAKALPSLFYGDLTNPRPLDNW